MLQQAAIKWHSRIFQKREIDKQIEDYTAQLEDATKTFQVGFYFSFCRQLPEPRSMFQMSTLVHVHHAIGKRQHSYAEALPPYSADDHSSETKFKADSLSSSKRSIVQINQEEKPVSPLLFVQS